MFVFSWVPLDCLTQIKKPCNVIRQAYRSSAPWAKSSLCKRTSGPVEHFNRTLFIILIILNKKIILSYYHLKECGSCIYFFGTYMLKSNLKKEKSMLNIYFTYSFLNSVKHIWPAFKCLNFKEFYISTNLEWQYGN